MVIKKAPSALRVSMLLADHLEGETHGECIPIDCRGVLRLDILMYESFILWGYANCKDSSDSLRISQPTW